MMLVLRLVAAMALVTLSPSVPVGVESMLENVPVDSAYAAFVSLTFPSFIICINRLIFLQSLRVAEVHLPRTAHTLKSPEPRPGPARFKFVLVELTYAKWVTFS